MDMSIKDLFGLHFAIDFARALVKFQYSQGTVRRQEYRAIIKHIRRRKKREYGALLAYHKYSARDFYTAIYSTSNYHNKIKRIRYVIKGGGYGL